MGVVILILSAVFYDAADPGECDHECERDDQYEGEKDHQADPFPLCSGPKVGASTRRNGRDKHEGQHCCQSKAKSGTKEIDGLVLIGLRHHSWPLVLAGGWGGYRLSRFI